MTVERLIEELKKLPPQAAQQDIALKMHGEIEDVDAVRWEGNRTILEAP